MSTDREFVDDRYDAPDDPDPYDIVPNDFIQNWGGPEVTTIAGALRVAEQAPSTTDRDEMPRCPECESVKLRIKPGQEQSNSREGSYQCVSCKAHIETPLPPEKPDETTTQATLDDPKAKRQEHLRAIGVSDNPETHPPAASFRLPTREELQTLREQCGKSRAQVTAGADVSKATAVRNAETGASPVRINDVQALLDYYDGQLFIEAAEVRTDAFNIPSGSEIRAIRLEAGETAVDCAEVADVTADAFHSWERASQPTLQQWRRVLAYLQEVAE